MRSLSSVLFGVALAYGCLCLAAFLLQRSMIYFPTAARVARPAFSLNSSAGPVLVSAREPLGASSAIVYLGGNAEDVALSLEDLAAVAFPRRAVFVLHYRGYGGSAGSPTEAALLADALALFDAVQGKYPDVALIGRSLGSGPATYVAALRPSQVRRLVLVTPFDSLQEVAAHHYPFLPVRWLLRDKYEAWRHTPEVQAQTLLIAAEQDEIVPRERTDRLLGSFPAGRARMVVVRGARHNSLDHGAEYWGHLQAGAGSSDGL